MCIRDRFKAGLWVRDSSAGIGTVTFYDRKNGIFAGLGHAVNAVIEGNAAVRRAVLGSKDMEPVSYTHLR